jgi:Putative mono-oxygenase ydhR
MSQKILHINGRLVISAEEFEQNNPPESANVFLDVPGLLWKIGYINSETLEAGGIYLFKDEATLQAFLTGPIASQFPQAPIWKDVTMKTLDILVDFSKILHAPIGEAYERETAR